MIYPLQFFYQQFFVTPPYPTADFGGQTVIVTGSNVGLGLEAARHIVRLNAAKVILAVRNLDKGQAAKEDIEASTKRIGVVDVWALDLSSYSSVKAFARRVDSELERLDAVIENAGILTFEFTSVDGVERTLMVNTISTVLLGTMLLPKLKQSSKRTGQRGRLAFIGSDLQYVAKLTEQDVEGKSLMNALNDPKTANMSDRQVLQMLNRVRLRD